MNFTFEYIALPNDGTPNKKIVSCEINGWMETCAKQVPVPQQRPLKYFRKLKVDASQTNQTSLSNLRDFRNSLLKYTLKKPKQSTPHTADSNGQLLVSVNNSKNNNSSELPTAKKQMQVILWRVQLKKSYFNKNKSQRRNYPSYDFLLFQRKQSMIQPNLMEQILKQSEQRQQKTNIVLRDTCFAKYRLQKIDDYASMTVNYNIMSSQKPRNSLSKTNILKSNKTFIEGVALDHEALFTQVQNMDLEPLKKFDIPSLTNMMEKFHKEVKSPIEIQTSIFTSKSLQRCLDHNNVTTLYCVSDKKPLCVTCMYQNNGHKKHKVVPLNRASQNLQEEKVRNVMTVERAINTLDKLVSQSNSNLTRAQKEFPDIMGKLSQFYKGLQQLLIQKLNQQLKHIQLVWQKMRYEYSCFSQELSDIKIFVVQQLRDVKRREGEEYVLFNRNITCNLLKIQEILQGDICSYHQNNFLEQLKSFRQFQIQIGQKLVLTSPFKQKIKRQAKQGFSYMNQASKQILKSKDKQNQAAEVFEISKDNRNAKERSLSAKQQQALKNNIDALNRQRKRKSLSPKPFPFRPGPAVSAHKSPQIKKPTKT